ncbi:GNAT family N-acetyltransferase [uncultured Sunxiuqinia sp.]|uniref:GNAT family N-acetyltransferase n=1 Tax=uncultured Sunxiuqinia sp. TaxID=1573825 RepID=UPI0026381004|nr:GNAT family N-acetyltransferase [uncultured Sunxiuqinia sp.]
MELKKIRLQELESFLTSDFFRDLETKPISPARVASYVNNPHAEAEDPVLYLLHDDTKLIAFRTLYPARLMNQSKRIAWLSGNWVHPDYRRRGYSTQLLTEALKDWEERLLFTNYAPASLQVYLKSEFFTPMFLEDGVRFYFFVKTADLLRDRFKGMTLFFKVVDVFIRLLANLMRLLYHPRRWKQLNIDVLDLPDEACYRLVEAKKDSYLFERGQKELEWIFAYPWVSTAKKDWLPNYPFSSYASQFHYKTVKFMKGRRLIGFLIYSIRDGHLKTVHLQLPQNSLWVAARFLIQLSVRKKIEILTILEPELAKKIQKHANPFLFHKRIEQGIYSSFPISAAMRKIQDGEGDFIFT